MTAKEVDRNSRPDVQVDESQNIVSLATTINFNLKYHDLSTAWEDYSNRPK